MIPISYIRSSSYGSHEMCEMKYFGEYALGWSGPSNLKADMGTIVHKVMEIFGHVKLAEQNGKTSFFDDKLEKDYSRETGTDAIIDDVYNYYTSKFDHHFWGPKEYKQCKKWSYKCLEFNNGQFHPFNQDIIQPEQHFDIEMKGDWAECVMEIDGEEVAQRLRVKGTIDLITRVDNNTNEIIDYKTGQRINWATGEEYNYENLHHNFQLRLYHYAHTVLYPEIPNVLVTIYYINTGGPFTLTFGRSDISDTVDMIRDKFIYIKNTEKPKPNYTWKCKKFCHFGKETFEDKEGVKALRAGTDCRLTEPGECMKMCDQILYTLNHRPIDLTIANLTRNDHCIMHYAAPGDA